MDAPALPPFPAADQEQAYVYAATDIRPRQSREIELCEKASHFDWMYTGAFALGVGASIYLNIDRLKHSTEPGVRMAGPALIGFTWGAFLSGGYLSLPKCDPLWAGGPAPEGNVRAVWPIATAISVIAAVTGPIMDYAFLGPVKLDWSVTERTSRVFLAAGTALVGSLFPYLVPPSTWSARKQIDRIRVEGYPTGAALTYTVRF